MKDIKDFKAQIKKIYESLITKEMKLEWAQKAADTIYKRTKAGQGLSSNKVSVGGNSLVKLKELSDPYKQYRSKKVLGPFGAPKRSNLTFSGELLESIIAKMQGSDAVVVMDTGDHYSGVSVDELAKKVSDDGRPFFGLADVEVKVLENFVKRQIRDKIRSKR